MRSQKSRKVTYQPVGALVLLLSECLIAGWIIVFALMVLRLWIGLE